MESVDLWLGGHWDHPDYHCGWAEVRLRAEPDPLATVPAVERYTENARPKPATRRPRRRGEPVDCCA
jgi:hypothetical protein